MLIAIRLFILFHLKFWIDTECSLILNFQICRGYKARIYEVNECTCKKLLTSLMCRLRFRFSDKRMFRLGQMFCVMSVTQPDAPGLLCSMMLLLPLSCPDSFSNSPHHCVTWNLLDKNAVSGSILIIIICRII